MALAHDKERKREQWHMIRRERESFLNWSLKITQRERANVGPFLCLPVTENFPFISKILEFR